MAKVKVDFSETRSNEGKKGRARKHYPPGDYAVKCTSATLGKSTNKETPGIHVVYKFTSGKFKNQEVHDDLWLTDGSLWRVRQTMEAMGIKVPNKAVNIDTDIFRGKSLAVTLDDEEYEDKLFSRVVDTFLLSELDTDETEADEDEEEEEAEDVEEADEDEDEEEEETPKSKKAKKVAVEDDLEDLDLDDL
jgi:hypothetical protein